MSIHSHDDDGTSDAALSQAVLTPRGGFMARPGLKTPPRHAVVVRGGNADVSADIPVARSSCPPPASPSNPPPSDEARLASCDKVTLPAIPRLPVIEMPEGELEKFDTLLPPPPDSAPAAWTPRSIESVPPPSDAPVASSVRDSTPTIPAPRRRSRWSIVAAAAIGLLLGIVSIAMTMSGTSSAARPSEPQPIAAAAQPVAAAEPQPARDPAVELPTSASAEVQPPTLPAAPARAVQLPIAGRKKSIF
jgi:hypothetical protein